MEISFSSQLGQMERLVSSITQPGSRPAPSVLPLLLPASALQLASSSLQDGGCHFRLHMWPQQHPEQEGSVFFLELLCGFFSFSFLRKKKPFPRNSSADHPSQNIDQHLVTCSCLNQSPARFRLGSWGSPPVSEDGSHPAEAQGLRRRG